MEARFSLFENIHDYQYEDGKLYLLRDQVLSDEFKSHTINSEGVLRF